MTLKKPYATALHSTLESVLQCEIKGDPTINH